MRKRFYATLALLAAVPLTLWAGKPQIRDVQVTALGNNQYRFSVTLEHADSGWDHFANRWQILSAQGEVLATRELAHPHVNEQPFTRSLTATLPAGTRHVLVRAFDSVHGASEEDYPVSLGE
ncbi:hypothetical protein Q4485_07405 [Granulosicoccaceae sp. 1_MG-2023]|nr:hypothetical protein [Granulosicoccaceae sp. 1_MG-2023]